MTLALAQHVSVSRDDDGMVLLDERTGRYWQLNASGARALDLLLTGHDVEDTVRGFGAPSELTPRVTSDVSSLLDALRTAGLVTS